jgi:hypothetical protein
VGATPVWHHECKFKSWKSGLRCRDDDLSAVSSGINSLSSVVGLTRWRKSVWGRVGLLPHNARNLESISLDDADAIYEDRSD